MATKKPRKPTRSRSRKRTTAAELEQLRLDTQVRILTVLTQLFREVLQRRGR